ncbi:MAG: amidohydrolase [Planctomycetales bacterium]|nr:amidohydrolase [Planctomycetales bacterium]
MSNMFRLALAACFIFASSLVAVAEEADLILHNGTVLTVDAAMSEAQAVALKDGKFLAVGDDATVLKLRGPKTEVIDLGGKVVVPGLIDSHVHPGGAAMHEFEHEIPVMESIQDVLDYVKHRADVLDDGEWIGLSQVFITRLKERRYPTKAELDAVAPNNPVVFSTGPDSSVNSMALKLSGIDKDFVSPDPAAKVEKDPKTGEPTGILRSGGRFLKRTPNKRTKSATEEDTLNRLAELFADYNRNGITGVCDRNCSQGATGNYQKLLAADRLTVRMAVSRGVGNSGAVEKLVENIKAVAKEPLVKGGPMLRIVGIKCFLDGGMLTGSAYMREPWGVSDIYSISDPTYQGMLYIPQDKLVPMVRAAVESGLQFTAHSVGDGAVHALLAAYETVNQSTPVAPTRPCLTHSNFMSKEAVEQCAKLGVVCDIQPAWLWLDGETLRAQFGDARLRYFQPHKSLFAAGVTVGGGSDHMQKIGGVRSVNPYDPWLGMQIAMTRMPRGATTPLHPEEIPSRADVLRMYTTLNARLMFLEQETGSIEPGKLADLVVVDRNPLTCPVETVRETKVFRTYLGGKLVYSGDGAR